VGALPRIDDLTEGVEAIASAFFVEREDAGAKDGRTAASDEAVLEGIYADLAPRIFRFQKDLLGDATLAKDATQETFIRAFRCVRTVTPGVPVVPWVYGIARKVSMELRRARGRLRRVVSEGTPIDECLRDPAGRSPEECALDREALLVVHRSLELLSEDRRAVLLLRFDHGLAYEDIAGLMEWSLAKVKVEIFRAREVLRAEFEAYRGGVP
jgi:RNA polymerase sigma-70 factor, ECF subfamily